MFAAIDHSNWSSAWAKYCLCKFDCSIFKVKKKIYWDNIGHKNINNNKSWEEIKWCTKPGKTSAWWNNFLNENIDPGYWKESFRMCERNFQKLCDELRLFITGKETAILVINGFVADEHDVSLILEELPSSCTMSPESKPP